MSNVSVTTNPCHPGQAKPNASSAQRRAGTHSDSAGTARTARTHNRTMGPGSRCAVQARPRLAEMTNVGQLVKTGC
jgi:hypothetical protein